MNFPMDTYDDLAALFLTEPDATNGTNQPPAPAPIELLLVGHLPVRGGLWLAPYAEARARTAGPVSLIRLDGEAPLVQVQGASAEARTLPAESSWFEVVERLARSIRLWIVRAAPSMGATEMIRSGADRITILSSRDDAAVVAAYRLVKDLADAADQCDAPVPPLSLAVLGADEAAGRAVLERLNRTTKRFLGLELTLLLALPQIDAPVEPAVSTRLAAQRCPDLEELVAWLRPDDDHGTMPAPPVNGGAAALGHDATAPAAETPDRPTRSTPRLVHEHAPAPARPSSREPEAPAPAAVGREPMAEEPPQAENEGVAGFLKTCPAPVSMKLAPKPSLAVEPKSPAAVHEPDDGGHPRPLAQHVAGLAPMTIRCPDHEGVELALDGAGRLHLLGDEGTLRDLPIVRAWAWRHREILAAACPKLRMRHAQHAWYHIFTSEPVRVADLHGSDFHLHVLAPVEVDGRRGWYTAPLSAPSR